MDAVGMVIDTGQNDVLAISPEVFLTKEWTEIDAGFGRGSYRFWCTDINEDELQDLDLKSTTAALSLNYNVRTGEATVDELNSADYHEIIEWAI